MQGQASAPTPPAPMSLGSAVGRGISLLSVSLVVGKFAGAAAHLLLGRWITAEQFGDFAVVMSIAAMIKIFQDGGVSQLLIQRGNAEFTRLMGSAFWLSAAIGLVGGLTLAAAAPVVAWIYDSPSLTAYLLIIAVTLPLGAPAAILRAKLRIDLRFQAVAVIALYWFLLRHFSTVGLAALGLGVMALVIPILLVTLFEGAAAYFATRLKPWRRPPQVSDWPSMIHDTLWIAVTAVSRGLARTGDYLVLRVLIPTEMVGTYFFAYQLTAQVVELLATNLQHVMFPALSRLADQPQRQASAILRTIRMLTLVAAPMSLLLAVTVDPLIRILDRTIWQTNPWSAAIPLIQIFAVAAPLRMFSDVLATLLASRSQFRGAALLTLAEGVWLMVATAIAVVIAGESLLFTAALIALAQIAFSVAASMTLLRNFGVTPRMFLPAFLPGWFTSLAATLLTAATIGILPADSPWLELPVAATVFSLSFVPLARITLRSDLEGLVRVAPARIATVVRRLFFLPLHDPA